jgi:carboxylesterase
MSESDIACLLLHGYGGSPFELEYLSRRLETAGIPARTVCLPGHGSRVEEFFRTRFDDWSAAAEQAYLEMRAERELVAVVGLSMGGSLALMLAERHDPAALVTIAAPVFLYRLFPFSGADWRLPFVPLVRHLRPVWQTARPSPEALEIAPCRSYKGVQNLHCLHSFMRGLKAIRRDLGSVRAPLLAIHCPTDKVSPVENAFEIVRRTNSICRRLELLPINERVTRHHLLTTHRETRDRVAELCIEHLRSHVGCVSNADGEGDHQRLSI